MDMAAKRRMINDFVYVCVCARVCVTIRMFTILCVKHSAVCLPYVCVCVRVREIDGADDGFSSGACGRWFLGQTR